MYFVAALTLGMALTSCNAQQNNNTQFPANADAAQFEQLMNENPGQLVDVRTPEEYAQGHLAGSKLMNFYSEDFATQLETLDPEQPVYVYCRSGGRSGKAAEMLREKGFKAVVNLQGGVMGWESQNKPLVQ